MRGYLKLLKMFIARGAKVDSTRGAEKLTPLMGAAATGNIEVVKALLDAGADPTVKSADGKVARDFAEAANFRRIARLLAEAESQPRDGRSAGRARRAHGPDGRGGEGQRRDRGRRAPGRREIRTCATATAAPR